MKVTMMLADAAQAAEGKLYILGGGWSVTGPTPGPSAIALFIQVPWDRTNVEHGLRFDLVDSDGNAVELETDAGAEEPVTFEGSFEVGRPPGLKPGTSIDVPLAINVRPLPTPARRQIRVATLDQPGESRRLAAAILNPLRSQAGAQG